MLNDLLWFMSFRNTLKDLSKFMVFLCHFSLVTVTIFFFFFNIYPKYREMDHCLDQFLIICLYYLHCILVLDFLLGSPILRIKL
jgi:hypothetical protein